MIAVSADGGIAKYRQQHVGGKVLLLYLYILEFMFVFSYNCAILSLLCMCKL